MIIHGLAKPLPRKYATSMTEADYRIQLHRKQPTTGNDTTCSIYKHSQNCRTRCQSFQASRIQVADGNIKASKKILQFNHPRKRSTMTSIKRLKHDYPWIQTPLIVGAPMRLIALADLAVAISKAGTIHAGMPIHFPTSPHSNTTPLSSYL